MRFLRPFLPLGLVSGAEGGLNLTDLGQSEIKGRVKERRISFPDSLSCKPRENRADSLINWGYVDPKNPWGYLFCFCVWILILYIRFSVLAWPKQACKKGPQEKYLKPHWFNLKKERKKMSVGLSGHQLKEHKNKIPTYKSPFRLLEAKVWHQIFLQPTRHLVSFHNWVLPFKSKVRKASTSVKLNSRILQWPTE